MQSNNNQNHPNNPSNNHHINIPTITTVPPTQPAYPTGNYQGTYQHGTNVVIDTRNFEDEVNKCCNCSKKDKKCVLGLGCAACSCGIIVFLIIIISILIGVGLIIWLTFWMINEINNSIPPPPFNSP